MKIINIDNLRLVTKCIQRPRTTAQFLRNGFYPVDSIFSEQSDWNFGTLPRVPLGEFLPNTGRFDLQLIRAFDRHPTNSVTLEELCSLLAIAKSLDAKTILEIGTWDGNTTLNLVANTSATVVTVDLPPDFVPDKHRESLRFSDVKLNVTDRKQVGAQFKDHELRSRIRQVFGDSARLDWTQLGSPFDLIFIDGCHDYPYVKSDTMNALANLSPTGTIVWHDYGMIGNVARVVDQVALDEQDLFVSAIQGTRLAVALKREHLSLR